MDPIYVLASSQDSIILAFVKSFKEVPNEHYKYA